MLKRKLLLALAVLLPSYSYSDSIKPYYGYTGNAAADNALRWSMGNVLPDPPGLEIQNVIYSYRIQKETGDWVTVNVYNERADGNGYIFRETDEWKPGSLNNTQINKVVGVGSIHRDLWGDGGIDVEGNGSIADPNVIYTYRVDPCYDPQFDPSCPGYEPPLWAVPKFEYEYYDGTEWAVRYEFDNDEYNEEDEEIDEEALKEQEEEEEKDREERLEEALAEAGRSALFAEALAASQIADATQINLNSYTNKTIQGGVYNETVKLQDKQLPDAKSGLRNGLAQQLLHQKMVDMQYNRR